MRIGSGPGVSKPCLFLDAPGPSAQWNATDSTLEGRLAAWRPMVIRKPARVAGSEPAHLCETFATARLRRGVANTGIDIGFRRNERNGVLRCRARHV